MPCPPSSRETLLGARDRAADKTGARRKTGTRRKDGAGEGNRTLVISLEGFCSTIELHPHGRCVAHRTPLRKDPDRPVRVLNWWRGLDSNQRRRKPTDLQSAPFSHSGTSPGKRCNYARVLRTCQTMGQRRCSCQAMVLSAPAPNGCPPTVPPRRRKGDRGTGMCHRWREHCPAAEPCPCNRNRRKAYP